MVLIIKRLHFVRVLSKFQLGRLSNDKKRGRAWKTEKGKKYQDSINPIRTAVLTGNGHSDTLKDCPYEHSRIPPQAEMFSWHDMFRKY